MFTNALALFIITWVGILTLFTEIAKNDREVKSGRMDLKDYWFTAQGKSAITFSIVLSSFITLGYNGYIYILEVVWKI